MNSLTKWVAIAIELYLLPALMLCDFVHLSPFSPENIGQRSLFAIEAGA